MSLRDFHIFASFLEMKIGFRHFKLSMLLAKPSLFFPNFRIVATATLLLVPFRL